MNVLVLNCGSSSLKFQLIATDLERIARDEDRTLAKGVLERIGSQALVRMEATFGGKETDAVPLRDHRQAIDYVLAWLVSGKVPGIASLGDIRAVGHRVVHGGERFKSSERITADVVRGIEECIELAPLHNPANLSGIHAATAALGAGVPQVAVFDTAFHATMPETSFLYALPYQYYRRYKVRRYGFHGTSHRYVAYRYRQLTGKPKDAVDVVTLHLGNGCSACAVKGGVSVDTSMGMTPLEGLVMGTRAGDVDAAILEHLSLKEGLTLAQLEAVLNKQSGLLGISGLTNDMRELLAEEREHKDRRASLAIELFCYRVRKYVGSYLAAMGGADALVFAGGIGENAPEIRARIVQGLSWMGLDLDPAANAAAVGKEALISTPKSRLAAYVIPTNEELLIARDTVRAMAEG